MIRPLSWILPDPAQRRLRLPKLFDIIVRSDLAAGSVFAIEIVRGRYALACARHGACQLNGNPIVGTWLFSNFRPGAGSRVGGLECNGIASPQRHRLLVPSLCRRTSRASRQGLGRRCHPRRPDSPRGRGICRSILRRPKFNGARYLRLGFKVVGEWDVPKGGPHFWSMLYEH